MVIIVSVHLPKDVPVQSLFLRQRHVVTPRLCSRLPKKCVIYVTFGVLFNLVNPIRTHRITHTILLSPQDILGEVTFESFAENSLLHTSNLFILIDGHTKVDEVLIEERYDQI